MPQLDEYLVRRYEKGEVVLFIGAGMSRLATPPLPGWPDLLVQGVEWARRHPSIKFDPEEILGLIDSGDLILAAGALRHAMGELFFRLFLREVFLDPARQPGRAHELLRQLRFFAILTTNYDRLIEMALPPATLAITQQSPWLTSLTRGEIPGTVVKLHGDIAQPESIIFGGPEYREQMFASEGIQTTLASLYTSKTFLFLGYGLVDRDIDAVLEQIHRSVKRMAGPHYALIPSSVPEARRKDLMDGRGIHAIDGYDKAGFPDFQAFLEDLRDSLAPAPVSDADFQDIRSLLHLRGWDVTGERRAASRAFFDVNLTPDRDDPFAGTVCYVPDSATAADLEAVPHGADRRHLICRSLPDDRVFEKAAGDRILLHTREQFLAQLADFSIYLESLKSAYEASGIDQYFVELKASSDPDRKRVVPLDSFMDSWIAAPGRNHLSLLGGFGTGKTWFCRRLAHRAAARVREGGRIPILIPLRDHYRAMDIESMLAHALDEKFGVKLRRGIRSFDRLNTEGRLLIILDGFDEMERRASDYRTSFENFNQIARLVTPQSKVLLTCRTEFFRHRREEMEVFEEDGRRKVWKENEPHEPMIDIHARPGFEVAYLADFDDGQVREAIRKRSPDNADLLWRRVQSLPKVEELTHRPVLIEMVVAALTRIKRPEDLNVARLYKFSTLRLLRERETKERRPFLPASGSISSKNLPGTCSEQDVWRCLSMSFRTASKNTSDSRTTPPKRSSSSATSGLTPTSTGTARGTSAFATSQ